MRTYCRTGRCPIRSESQQLKYEYHRRVRPYGNCRRYEYFGRRVRPRGDASVGPGRRVRGLPVRRYRVDVRATVSVGSRCAVRPYRSGAGWGPERRGDRGVRGVRDGAPLPRRVVGAPESRRPRARQAGRRSRGGDLRRRPLGGPPPLSEPGGALGSGGAVAADRARHRRARLRDGAVADPNPERG